MTEITSLKSAPSPAKTKRKLVCRVILFPNNGRNICLPMQNRAAMYDAYHKIGVAMEAGLGFVTVTTKTGVATVDASSISAIIADAAFQTLQDENSW